MQSQHTPGPWEVAKRDGTNVFPVGGSRLIATTAGYSNNLRGEEVEVENRANARLIAAAPEMLVALEHMASICPACSGSERVGDLKCGACYDARLAIRLARGEES